MSLEHNRVFFAKYNHRNKLRDQKFLEKIFQIFFKKALSSPGLYPVSLPSIFLEHPPRFPFRNSSKIVETNRPQAESFDNKDNNNSSKIHPEVS